MFKPSVACKAPHCNIDSLRDKLFQACYDALACVAASLLKRNWLTRLPLRQLDVMAAHELRSADSLLDWCALLLHT
jgi:hypothetical protein